MSDPNYTIFLVEDDENDVVLTRMAFQKNDIPNPSHWTRDGAEAMAYLNGEGIYSNRQLYPFPDLLIVDLKIQRMNGLELLAWMHDHPEHRLIPTVILTSSQSAADIQKAYRWGANTYMIKPTSLEDLSKMIKTVHEYWAFSVRPKTKEGKHR